MIRRMTKQVRYLDDKEAKTIRKGSTRLMKSKIVKIVKNRLIQANLRLVINIAKKYLNRVFHFLI